MPELINDGKVYTACPPLFGVREGRVNKEGLKYFWNYKEVQDYINKKGLKQGQYELKRFKGLGEMNPDQLWDTCLDPSNRMLKRITIEDALDMNTVLSKLMGSDAKAKREFLTTGEL